MRESIYTYGTKLRQSVTETGGGPPVPEQSPSVVKKMFDIVHGSVATVWSAFSQELSQVPMQSI